jgi:ribonuclease I
MHTNSAAGPWLLPLAALLAGAASPAHGGHAYERWMEDNWDSLSSRTLLQLTLPGSHNSGNTAQELGTGPKCTTDDKYAAYQRQGGALSQAEFDPLFLPWNVNHHVTISDQLLAGIRWFHLKLCWVRSDSGEPLRLGDVRHQHRGFTADTAESIFGAMASFLGSHRRETVVIGINNLNQFADEDKAALAQLVVDAFAAAGITAVGPDRLSTATLAELAESSARVAIFFKSGAGYTLPAEVNPSAATLYENWDDRMESGDPDDAAAWLLEDVSQYATETPHERFYVLQANPNNGMRAMYDSVDAPAAAAGGGGGNSLRAWETGFLLRLGSLVRQALADNPTAVINAISTDYMGLSAVTELALSVAGLPLVEEDVGAHLWNDVLTACVRPATVDGMLIEAFDYQRLLPQQEDSTARQSFERYLAFLAQLPEGAVEAFTPRAKKALLINAYNALAVKVIVDRFVFSGAGATASIRDLGDVFSPVWTSTAGTLAGRPVSLDDIEKGTGGHDTGPNGQLMGLLPWFRDPRVHSSVVCASVSCPDMSHTAFTPANVETLLNDRVRAWLEHPEKGLSLLSSTQMAPPPQQQGAAAGASMITASKIFDWYRSDFASWAAPDGVGERGVRGFLRRFAPEEVSAHMSAMPPSSFDQAAMSYFTYNWKLNQYQAPAWWGSTGGVTGAARDDFSLFLLRLQWAPEWCCGKGTEGFCASPSLSGGDGGGSDSPHRLLIHGLWPQWDDASGNRTALDINGELLQSLYWPQYCNGGAAHDFSVCCEQQPGGGCHDAAATELCQLPDALTAAATSSLDLGALARDMPDYANQPAPDSGMFRLGDHEWMKHGSCSAMEAEEYVGAALDTLAALRQATPAAEPLLSAAAGLAPVLTVRHLQQAFGGGTASSSLRNSRLTALACKDGRLVAVSSCWERLPDGRVGARVMCPDNVLLERYSNSCIEQELVEVRSADQMRADPSCNAADGAASAHGGGSGGGGSSAGASAPAVPGPGDAPPQGGEAGGAALWVVVGAVVTCVAGICCLGGKRVRKGKDGAGAGSIYAAGSDGAVTSETL